MSSWRSRCLQPLVAGADQPRRTAVAFALGVFLSFSPFFGLQIATGLAVALAFGLNRPAVLIGVCTNLPWIMIPWYSLTTVAGAKILRLELPANLGERLGSLMELRIYTVEFWQRAADLLSPFVWAFLVGSVLGALIAGVVAYVLAVRFLKRIRLSQMAA